ncbi:MAG: histidine kinase [Gammaproteobacteria bacterium]|nr:histidine kinase [Gammaproteobacteria bacterium]
MSLPKNSLLVRLWLLMASITMLAVVSMVTSMVIADRLLGDASAINQAGSLRMQAYVALSTALTTTPAESGEPDPAFDAAEAAFLQRYHNPRLTQVLPTDPADPVRQSYRALGQAWGEVARPLLRQYLEVKNPGTDEATRRQAQAQEQAQDRAREGIREVVTRIDGFVRMLEQRSEDKVLSLRALHTATLFMTLPLIFLTMYFMQTEVLVPLKALLKGAQRARKGDFSVRVSDTSGHELGQLGGAFNSMAEDLSAQYRDLEARVAERTEALRRSNRALELLYRTLSRLNSAPAVAATYRALLDDLREVLGLASGALCMVDPGDGRGHVWITVPTATSTCAAPSCTPCLEQRQTEIRDGHLPDGGAPARLLTVPLVDKGQTYGVINLELRPGARLEDWQLQLATAVGNHVTMALANGRRSVETHRAALLEERAALARDLHDSLAQSLSYLKIQVARLESSLARGGADDATAPLIRELKDGLNGAYRQLRELLTTFRLEMDGRGLARALEETVAELQDRTSTRLYLDNRLGGCRLSPNEEIHVLQIVREALSNVIHHARATHATVALNCSGDGRVAVTVSDDGIGLAAAGAGVHHYGLTIMSERAESLGGTLVLEQTPQGGTAVQVAFPLSEDHSSRTVAGATAAAPGKGADGLWRTWTGDPSVTTR